MKKKYGKMAGKRETGEQWIEECMKKMCEKKSHEKMAGKRVMEIRRKIET